MKIAISDMQNLYKAERWPLRQAVQMTIRYEKASRQSEVTIALVDDETIARLNMSYRGKDSSTDVLSFNLAESDHPELKDYLGDIVVSVETAARQAAESGHSLVREIEMLLIHGTLHLLGYDDQTACDRKVMMKKQAAIIRRLVVDTDGLNKPQAEIRSKKEEEPVNKATAFRCGRERGRRKKEKSSDAQQETS